MLRWDTLVPIAALALFGATFVVPMGVVVAVICAVALVTAVIAAVHHAEVVAARVGEPFGTLVLALAVTVIEVALIVSVMLADGAANATLPRDTIFAAVMIICTGVVGMCVLVGGIHHREQRFQLDGATPALGALVALAGLSLVMPSFTTSSPTGTYTVSQLMLAAVSSLVMWGTFVFVQTVRHRDYFLPATHAADESVHATPPTRNAAIASFGLLLVSLVAVVGLAKRLSPTIESAIAAAGAPKAVLGIVIAFVVLLPETWAAVRAARADRLQTSMNLALGSALASIGLTIPVVVVAAVLLDLPLVLGLGPKDLALLVLTFLVSAITLSIGRTTIMLGVTHLVLFAAFVFLAFVP
jgi:Ca2+:H+ antiporter